jgi:hypothetical protein
MAGAPGAAGRGEAGTEEAFGALPMTVFLAFRLSISEIATARTAKPTKDHVVIRSRTVVVPRAPNVVWDDAAPKALATSAPFPCCRRTTRIRKTQTMT